MAPLVKMNNNSKNKNKKQNNKNSNNNKQLTKQPAPFTTPNKNVQVNLSRGLTPDANKYRNGLLNPFSDVAIGGRVPDQFFAPTVTYAFREFLTIKADASGEADVVICPSVLFPAFSTRNSIANGIGLSMKDGTVYGNGQYINSASALAQKMSNYRIVSWGIRVRQTQSITTSQGTITAALFVPKDGLYHPTIGSTNAPVGGQSAAGSNWSTSTMEKYLNAAGLPVTGTGITAKIDVTSLVDYPFHMRASCVNAAENTYEIIPKLTSPTGYHFRGCYDSVFGTDITGQTSVAFIQPGDSSYVLVDGWTNIVLAATGLVASSSGVLDIEIVYNIEGNPQLSYGGIAAQGVASGAKSVHDPIGMLIAQAALDASPAFKLLSASRAAFAAFSK